MNTRLWFIIAWWRSWDLPVQRVYFELALLCCFHPSVALCAPNYIESIFTLFGLCSHNVVFTLAQTLHHKSCDNSQRCHWSMAVLAGRHVSMTTHDYRSLFSLNMCSWVRPSFTPFTPQTNHIRICWQPCQDHLFTLMSGRPFQWAPVCGCCVHTDPSGLHSSPKFLWADKTSDLK